MNKPEASWIKLINKADLIIELLLAKKNKHEFNLFNGGKEKKITVNSRY